MDVNFEVGDAKSLPYPDAAFDVALSTVGVMFAPDQEKAASELLRVCRPGGKIGLASWTPDGFIGQMFRAIGRHVPPTSGIKSPPLWGTEERLRELFGDEVSSLQAMRRSYIFRYPSAQYYVGYFRDYYGPTLKAFETLDAEGRDALERDLEELLESWNISDDGTLIVPSEYLEVVTVRR